MREYEDVHATSRAAWRAWLRKHHAKSPGAWLVSWKKATGKPRVEYGEAVEEALCFGWIDSLPRAVDDERSKLLFTPRKPRSGWSRANKTRVAKLIASRRMTKAGLAAIEAAKANGSWSKLDASEAMTMPRELLRALRAKPAAKKHFDAFPPSVKKGLYQIVGAAKRPETKARRIREIVEKASRNRRAFFERPKR